MLWNDVSQKGYSFIDVPMALRRQAFGDEQAHRRRAWEKGRGDRFRAGLVSVLIKLAVLVVLAGIAWFLVSKYLLQDNA